MRDYRLTHLSDATLLHELTNLVAQDRVTTAELLAHLAEVDARRLYAPAGHSSMFAYCVEELRLSEDAAYKRIQAARAARRFPALFEAVAQGRIHLTGLGLIAPHLTSENAGELIGAVSHRRKSEIEAWLARRFPAPETRTFERAIVRAIPARQLAPAQVEGTPLLAHDALEQGELATERVGGHGSELAPERLAAGGAESGSQGIESRVPGVSPAAPSPERYLVQVTITKSTHEKLRRAQALLSHAVPSGDLAQVLDRALDSLIEQLEKRKLGAAKSRPPREPRALVGRSPRKPSTPGSRHVPAQVRRAVWERDRGQCTFVSAGGRRCGERKFLEYDHVEPVARGGTATVDGMRLRCRAHNQYEADRAFGAGFMDSKREAARAAASRRGVPPLAKQRTECPLPERAVLDRPLAGG
jgi:5-methylcytosine-specific restriction endonuclease McrA